MGLFSKKKKEEEDLTSLPELPDASSKEMNFPSANGLPPLEQNSEITGLPDLETNTLPTLPDSEAGKSFNQQAIKDAVTEPSHLNSRFQKSKFAPVNPSQTIPNLPPKILPGGTRTLELNDHVPKSAKKAEPVFIRLDKFQTTVETFEEIKEKITDIEELLKRTKEIKQQEEQELNEWEREIQIIKSRIETIDRNIFNKLD